MFAGNRVIAPVGLGWRRGLPVSTPDAGAVLRSLLGLLAIAAVAVYWGPHGAGMWVTAAGAIAGAIALRDSPGGRVPVVLAVSLELGLVVLIATLSAPYRAVFVAVVALWCFTAGMQWALGENAGLVAVGASALLVVAPPVPMTVAEVTAATALTVLAGLIQAALITVWPPRRWRAQRDALSRAYRSLAVSARQLAGDAATPVDTAPLTWLRDAFAESPALQRPRAYHGGYRVPERITATLNSLRSASTGPPDAKVSALLDCAAVLFDAIADHSRSARRDAEHALARVDAAAAALTGAEGGPEAGPEAAVAQRFSRQLHEAVTVRFGELRGGDLIDWLAGAPRVVRDQFTWTSPVLRHAIRLAVATALATAAARYGELAHGYWMPLTVLLVLRPETAHTYTRCIGRIAGVGVGIAVATALTIVWQPAGMAAVGCATVFIGLVYAVSGLGFLAVSATLALAIEFIVGITAGAGGAGFEERMFAVVIGGSLAVIAHVVLPDHAFVRLRHRAGELLKAEIDYAAMVIRAYVHELDRPAEALAAAWQRAFRARAAFEAASGATRVESRELRRWLRSYRAALNAVTGACTSLESTLSTPATSSSEFVAAVDDYTEALRGAPPSPATPWTVDAAQLTAAQDRLRDVAPIRSGESSARVLIAEIGTITRQLLSIADVGDGSDWSANPPAGH